MTVISILAMYRKYPLLEEIVWTGYPSMWVTQRLDYKVVCITKQCQESGQNMEVHKEFVKDARWNAILICIITIIV